MSLRSSALEAVDRCLAREGVSRAELSRRTGTSRGFISQLLNGSGRGLNITTKTLDRIFDVLGYEAKVIVTRKK